MEEKSIWARLRWPIKAIIIAIPIIGLGYWALESGKIDAATNTEGSKKDSTEQASSPAAAKSEDKRSFNYTPEKPVNGEYKGVVEVGASGFNSFVVNIDKEKRWEIISKDFGKSFVYEGLANTADIRTGLKDYIGAMFDKGVKSKNIHFVISSGAQKEPKTTAIVSELKKMGFVVNLVTAEQEGKLALKCVLPASYYDNSFVVDIGSGNTKISWMDGDVKSSEAPGAKYYEKNLKDDAVYDLVKSVSSKIPSTKHEVCFIIGGVPFELAKQTRTGDERFTVLNDPDKYNTDKIKIKSGVNIYKAIKDATNCDTFVFDWDANFTIGFLLALK
ncbi:hypothetical protein G7074_26150 [Pedobacter sp. HDW13]|uniref:hypothetical protein n=1 Tax=unclassified Pedobacter TaxID=2628915 RepID=UPI000F5A4A98|nr:MULTISPECIES: hypothetical protein [unclassified Pedobacter]QIL42437.1 hypothetical protein G7074_26150 [Pedobacter sp. HDW13]RQO78916.1 hypothetical protein DBR40_04105 [Pedobacter sp. KBW01]